MVLSNRTFAFGESCELGDGGQRRVWKMKYTVPEALRISNLKTAISRSNNVNFNENDLMRLTESVCHAQLPTLVMRYCCMYVHIIWVKRKIRKRTLPPKKHSFVSELCLQTSTG